MMATTTLGVLSYTIPNLKIKNQLENENDVINMSDSSMDQIIVNKKSKINQTTALPTSLTSQSNDSKIVLGNIAMNQQTTKAIVQPTKKRRVSDGSSSSGKTKQPLAVAVERRNARERNRVKQVNNGFQALREHIPEEIAETYESAGRGSAKKLSKVETLRMAVEYIRVLENMLNLDSSKDSGSFNNTSNFSNISSAVSEASLPATPPPDQQIFYAIKPRQMGSNDLMGVSETQITIINGHQYLRIPGTNTFQLITPNEHFENEENIHPNDEFIQTNFIHTPVQFQNQLTVTQTPSPQNTSTQSSNLVDSSSSLNFININSSNNSSTTTTAMQETPLRIITPAGSISPSTYSGHSSLSPASSRIDNINNNIIMKQPKFEIITEHESKNPSVHFSDNLLMVNDNGTHHNDSHYNNIILKEEIDEDNMFDEGSLNSEHMLEAVSWYQQQLIQDNNQNGSP